MAKLTRILKNTNQFGFTESRNFKLSLALSISLFSVLVLIVFQPFGINNYNHELKITLKWLFYIFTLGFVLFLALVVSEFVIRTLVVKKSTLLHLTIWFLWEFIFAASILFLYYNFLGGFHDLTLSAWVIFVLNAIFVMIMPFLGTIFFFNYRRLKKEYSDVLILSKERTKLNDLMLISGDYKKDRIALAPGKIVYMDSQDNYVALYYLEEGKLKYHLIRSSLSRMEKALEYAFILRCNRSIIANFQWVESVKEHGNMLSLKLQHYPDPITVTNKYLPRVKEFLKNNFE